MPSGTKGTTPFCSSSSSSGTKTCSYSTSNSSSATRYCSSGGSKSKSKSHKTAKSRHGKIEEADCCCGEPVRVISKPGFGCYERVNGPFKHPIPTPYDQYLQRFNKGGCCNGAPPCPPFMKAKQVNTGCRGEMPMNCCDGIRQQKVCQAELERLRQERWKEQAKKATDEDKRRKEWLEQQYMCQVRQWEEAQAKCTRDQERRKRLLKEIQCQRKEMGRLREEAQQWRRHQKKMRQKEKQNEEDQWVQQYSQREEERRWEQNKLKMIQEDKLLEAQMAARCSKEMKVPELEELRRMFAPVARGPNETFEYFLVEPRPTTVEMKKNAEMKMCAMLGLRKEHGIHLDLSDRCKKKTTIQLAMGPKLAGSERSQFCNVITTPGASCCTDKSPSSQCLPNVPVPKCLRPLMQNLSYRVNEMNSPLLRMQGFGPGPNYNGSKLYGTIVIPKGKTLSPYYTDPYAVTF